MRITTNVFIGLSLLCLLLNSQLLAASLGNHNKRFTPVSEMQVSDWTDENELQRTWDAALVRIPKGNGSYVSTTMEKLGGKDKKYLQAYPTVIYMHGCSGIWDGTYTRINWLAKSGFAVIAPASFARKRYPKSCDPYYQKGGFYHGTLMMRQNDAGNAISHAKNLQWVDSENVFLMGLSQGGITTATFSSKNHQQSVNARVIEGWTCNAGWHEYKGINAPANEPVLSLVGKKDPWFQNDWTRGHCGSFMNKNNGSRSIEFDTGNLQYRHELLEDKSVQKIVLEFLQKHIK